MVGFGVIWGFTMIPIPNHCDTSQQTLWRAFHPKPTRISVGSSVVTGLFKSFASFVSRQWAKLRGYKELRATYEVNRSFSSKAFVEGICSPRK